MVDRPTRTSTGMVTRTGTSTSTGTSTHGHEHAGTGEDAHAAGFGAKPVGWRGVVRGVFETWAHLGPWILFGLFATVVAEHYFMESATGWAASITPWQQVLALTLLGLPSYICATAATPFAAVLLASGFSPGAVLAFLLTGPATNWTTFAALSQLHSRKVALLFAATALVVTVALGLGVNTLLGPVASGTGPDHGAPPGMLNFASTAVLCALTLWVALRLGPRGFLAQLSPGAAPHVHGPAPDGPRAEAPGPVPKGP
ncbi:MAG: permease [Planctomycetes bacterium]|nr:permease [Planctomycetota bacterium]